MESLGKILASSIVAVATIGSLLSGVARAQDESTKLTRHNNGYNIHVFPTVTAREHYPHRQTLAHWFITANRLCRVGPRLI